MLLKGAKWQAEIRGASRRERRDRELTARSVREFVGSHRRDARAPHLCAFATRRPSCLSDCVGVRDMSALGVRVRQVEQRHNLGASPACLSVGQPGECRHVAYGDEGRGAEAPLAEGPPRAAHCPRRTARFPRPPRRSSSRRPTGRRDHRAAVRNARRLGAARARGRQSRAGRELRVQRPRRCAIWL